LFSEGIISSPLCAAVSLQIPTSRHVSGRAAACSLLLGIAPLNFTVIDAHVLERATTARLHGNFAYDAIAQFIRHEPHLFGTGPADLNDNLVDVRAIGTGYGQLGRGLVQQSKLSITLQFRCEPSERSKIERFFYCDWIFMLA